MRTIDRDLIARALDNAGIDPEESIREGYSGKGMFGSECFGIQSVVLSQLLGFFVELATLEDGSQDIASDLADRVRSDTLGHSSIYYFPGFTLGEED